MSRTPWELGVSCGDDDPTLLFLNSLFRRTCSPLITGLLLTACGAEGAPAERAASIKYSSMHCDGMRWRPMSNLALAQAVDYASLRRAVRAPHPTVQIVDAAGQPCAGGREPRLCEAEARRLSVLEADTFHSHLLTTRGDTVRAFQTLAEKLELLGAIDTPDEALLVLEHEYIPIGCNQTSQGEATVVTPQGDGYRVTTQTPDACGNERFKYTVDVARDGSTNVVKEPIMRSNCAIGRRPPNLVCVRRRAAEASELGRYFASAARLEAASVDAFEQLLLELRQFGAPRALWHAAYAAAEDEVRHARATAALAERFGARPLAPNLRRRRLRGRAEVALDNALEGCVQESYGAYLATLQAGVARDPEVRRALAQIARDETRHAALSWQLAGWLEPQLPPSTRRRVDAARAAAIAALGERSHV
jgi:hypothetical protein